MTLEKRLKFCQFVELKHTFYILSDFLYVKKNDFNGFLTTFLVDEAYLESLCIRYVFSIQTDKKNIHKLQTLVILLGSGKLSIDSIITLALEMSK